MFDASRYTITIKKVDADGEILYLATVKELPDVGPYAADPHEAYKLALDIIKTLNEMAAEEGRHFPAPMETETAFSGRFTLRLPKTLHRKAAQFSDTEGVSLNQFFVSVIAEAVGERKATKTIRSLAATQDYRKLVVSQSRAATTEAILSTMLPPMQSRNKGITATTATTTDGFITETTDNCSITYQ